MTLSTEILSIETSGFFKQIIFLKSFNSVFYGFFGKVAEYPEMYPYSHKQTGMIQITGDVDQDQFA